MNEFNTILKIEDHVNRINNYYGGKLIVLEYASYYGINANNVGGLSGRKMFFYIGPVAIAISDELRVWDKHQPLRSPANNVNNLTGQNPQGSIFDTDAYVHLSNDRPTSFIYTVLWAGGSECYADNITISYVLNMHINFTEEYLQRYHYNVIQYGCLFYYINQKGRWRHLNTINFKDAKRKSLRTSGSTINMKMPNSLQIFYSNFIVMTTGNNKLLFENYLYKKINKLEYDFTNIEIMNFEVNVEFRLHMNLSYDENSSGRTADHKVSGSITMDTTTKFIYDQSKNIQELSNSIPNNFTGKLKYSWSISGQNDAGENDITLDWHVPRDTPSIWYTWEYIGSIPGFNKKNYYSPTTRYIVYNDYLVMDFVYPLPGNGYNYFEQTVGGTFNTTYTKSGYITQYEYKIRYPELLKGMIGFGDSNLIFPERTRLYLRHKNTYQLYKIKNIDNFFVKTINQTFNNNRQNILMIGVDKIQLFDYNFDLITKFSIKDKIGNLFINQKNIYNSIPEKGLIKKYEIPNFNNSDPSDNTFPEITGKQILQDYTYSGYGNTFSIFNDVYAVVGTTEGKVIIQHLNDKTAAKAVINSGSSNYSNFGSVIRSGKQIYINAPELDRLYVISSIPYYE